MNYSTYHYRIKTLLGNPGPQTWLFLPGGPGLGSAYLESLALNLNLPGTTLLLDFPKDGDNTEGLLNLSYWKKGLIDLLSQYEHPILVTHSFAGMFALDTPELEPLLKGLVLMNTTTHNTFFEQVQSMQEKHKLPDLAPAAAAYHLNPSSQTYQEFWNDYKHYCFTPEELAQGERMMSLFAFNSTSYQYTIEHFFADYQYRWHPSIPTLTISGEYDFICPPRIFTDNKAFNKKHCINKIIPKAGHCSWIVGMKNIKSCFAEYINIVSSRKGTCSPDS